MGSGFARYFDRDHAATEHRHVLMKSWIGACREEDLANVGDRLPFNVGPASFRIVRNGEDSFKAFNGCLHRGTELCSAAGTGASIRCPFHAWEWKLDGGLKSIPNHWDFKSVMPANGALRQRSAGEIE